MHPDDFLRRDPELARVGRIDPLEFVIAPDDAHTVGRALEHLADQIFGALAFAQIDHERDGLVAPFRESRGADQHRHARSVLADILFLEWLAFPGRRDLILGPQARVAPFGGRHLHPADLSGDKIVAAVSHDLQEGVVRLEKIAAHIRDRDADDVRSRPGGGSARRVALDRRRGGYSPLSPCTVAAPRAGPGRRRRRQK